MAPVVTCLHVPGNPLKNDGEYEVCHQRRDEVMIFVASPWKRIRLPGGAHQLAYDRCCNHCQIHAYCDRHLRKASTVNSLSANICHVLGQALALIGLCFLEELSASSCSVIAPPETAVHMGARRPEARGELALPWKYSKVFLCCKRCLKSQ